MANAKVMEVADTVVTVTRVNRERAMLTINGCPIPDAEDIEMTFSNGATRVSFTLPHKAEAKAEPRELRATPAPSIERRG